MATAPKKIIIGRAETIHFMDFAIADIPAKVDTGAYHSAVHADQIKLLEDDKKLQFRLLGNHPVFGSLATVVSTPKFKMVNIQNSFGHDEDRYEVTLDIKIGSKVFKTNFTLANRSKGTFPILLGRKLLNDQFIVDTSKTSVDRLALKRQYGIVLNENEKIEEQ